LRRKIRSATHVLVALLPQFVKKPLYRHVFGFEIATDATIGVSVLDVDHLSMGAGARIGHGNLLTRTTTVELGPGAEIGLLNILRGGERITLGAYSTVMRWNVLNSIPDNDASGNPDPSLSLGPGATIVAGHRIDFTDRVSLGKNVVVAGRNSSLWSHSGRETLPIEIGDYCYIGSESRLAPGAKMGELSILGLGGVLVGTVPPRTIAGGVPAKPICPIGSRDEHGLKRKTRKDIPEDLY
jgi:acetyltransferase-like isoleucine patch superfamily enzyme